MVTWKRIWVFLVMAVVITGCAQQPMYTGAAIGGGVGALTGAAVDHNNPWRGATIGGLMGGVLGGAGGYMYQRSQVSQQGGYYDSPGPGYNYGYSYPSNGGYSGYSGPPPSYGSGPGPSNRYAQPPMAQGPGSYGD